MPVKSFVLTVIILFSLHAPAQEIDSTVRYTTVFKRKILVAGGFTFGQTSKFVELGMGKGSNGRVGHHPAANMVYVANEMRVDTGQFIMGPKIGAWASGGVMPLAMGANMIYYTDFHRSMLVFKPEIGIGIGHVKLVYGYNVKLTKYRMRAIDYSVGSLLIGFGVKRLKDRVR